MFTNWLRSRIHVGHNYFEAVGWAAMLLALIGGIFFRLKGLGKSPFAIDEYYMATSIQNILDNWLPQFDCGGYYTRGLLLQYLAAPFFKFGSNDEFYFRLITVLFNLLTIRPLYLLAKRVSSNTVAYLAVILFCVSVWEVEFARFARMYAPFQMLFVWYVYFLYMVTMLGDTSAKKWMYFISFLSIFVYEGAVFMVLLNFFPFISNVNGKKTSAAEYILSVVILFIAVAFIGTDFRHLGIEGYLPAHLQTDSAAGSSLPIEMPVLLITTLPANIPWMVMFAIPLALSAMAIWRLVREQSSTNGAEITAPQALLFLLFVILSLLNLYGLLILLTLSVIILSLVFDWLALRQIRMRSLWLVFTAVGVTFVFWSCYAIFTDNWQVLIETDRTSPTERLVVVLFKYLGAIYSKIVFPWFAAMPVLTVATGILILFGFAESALRRYNERDGYLFFVVVLIGLAVAEVVLSQPAYRIRYTFFLYPIVLLLVAVSLKRLAQFITSDRKTYQISLAGVIFVFMVFSEDFDVRHLWNIDSDRVTYRLGYDWRKYLQYIPRMDFRTPAEIINENMSDGDIVVTTTYSTPYYLRQLDYFYINYASSKLPGIAGCGGKKEIWANSDLIYKPDELFHLLKNSESTVWLILRTGREKKRWKELEEIEEMFSRYRIFQSIDGKVFLYKIAPTEHRNSKVPTSEAISGASIQVLGRNRSESQAEMRGGQRS